MQDAEDGSVARSPGVPFSEAFRFWLKLGFISFGGPAGQIAVMHRELVERRKWISEERFLHALNYCMLLPGPEAQQLATYVGWLLHRTVGGIVAGSLFVLPSVFVLLGLSVLYATHGDTALVTGILSGFRPVVVAIVFEAVLRIGRRAIRSGFHFAVSAAAFIAIYALDVPFPAIILLAALAGWLARRHRFGSSSTNGDKEAPAINGGRAIDDTVPAPHTRPSPGRSLRVILVCAALWTIGLAVLVFAWGPDNLFLDEYGFFTRAALVTFGGAYAVLAYVAQAAVEDFRWLTHAAAVDGLALAETTPGPLIMVVQFIGFMAAWNRPVAGLSPMTSGVIGALVTTFVTFLPCFLFIFAGAPYIEMLRANRALDAALGSVTSAVVGVMLNLALVFGAAVLVPEGARGSVDWRAVSIVAIAFVVLFRFRAEVLWVVLAGGIAGLLLAH